MDYHQTNRKVDTGKTLKRWPVFVDHYISALKSELARIQGEMSIHINSHFSELSDLLSTEVGSVHPFGQNVCL
ncbi:hypothetical protein FR965_08130 [Serratia marcescens]|nr:hypothetical protein FR965_08130 [Serratia marcescens]